MTTAWHLSPVLRPLPFDGLYFHRRSIQSFEKPPPPDRTRSYGAVWFGLEGDKGQEPSCIVVVDVDTRRRMHLVECVHSVQPFDRMIDWLFKIHGGMHRTTVEATQLPTRAEIYGVRLWQCTQEQYQEAVSEGINAHIMRAKLIGRDRSMPLSALPNPFDFSSAARALQSEILAGRFLLPKSDPWVPSFLEELTQWPTVRTDARVRALAVLMSGIPAIAAPVARGDYVEPPRSATGWAA